MFPSAEPKSQMPGRRRLGPSPVCPLMRSWLEVQGASLSECLLIHDRVWLEITSAGSRDSDAPHAASSLRAGMRFRLPALRPRPSKAPGSTFWLPWHFEKGVILQGKAHHAISPMLCLVVGCWCAWPVWISLILIYSEANGQLSWTPCHCPLPEISPAWLNLRWSRWIGESPVGRHPHPLGWHYCIVSNELLRDHATRLVRITRSSRWTWTPSGKSVAGCVNHLALLFLGWIVGGVVCLPYIIQLPSGTKCWNFLIHWVRDFDQFLLRWVFSLYCNLSPS